MGSSFLLVLGLVAVALALVTIVLAIGVGAGAPTGVARSLAIIERSVDGREVGKHDLPMMDRLVYPLLNGTKSLGHRLSPEGTAERIAKRLDLAGNPEKWTPERVLGAKGTGLLIGALAGFVLSGFQAKGLLAVVGAAAGFFLPDLLLMNLGQKRQEELRRGLADALDMLTVCVEAGQGFDAALMQVARASDGPVAGEFARVLAEIQMGKSRGEAFASLGSRTTVAEAKTFVSALVQADRLGIPNWKRPAGAVAADAGEVDANSPRRRPRRYR